MKIPTLEQPRTRVAPLQQPYSNTNFDTGQSLVTKGMNQLAGGLETLDAAVEHQKDRANAVAANDLVTQFQHATTTALVGDSSGEAPESSTTGKLGEDGDQGFMPTPPKAKPGFLSTRGKAAFAQSGETLTQLEERRKQIAESATNDKQRALFLQHSGPMFENARARVEGHTAEQLRVAEVASVEGRKAVTLTAIANDYSNDAAAAEKSAAVEQSIRALSLPEEADAKVAEWRSAVAKARLNQYVAAKDIKGAEALFATVKDQLGPDAAPHFQHVITLEHEKQEASTTALKVMDGARDGAGFVLEDKAVADFAALPLEKRTDAAQQEFNRWLGLEREKRRATTEGVFNSALTSYLNGHRLADINPNEEIWLRKNDPRGWYQLEQMARGDNERSRNAQPTPDQERAMTEFLVDVGDHPDKYATMGVPEFRKTWEVRLGKSDRARAGAVLAQMHGKASKPDDLSPLENKMLLQIGRDAGVFDPKQNDVSKWGEDQASLYYRTSQLLSEMSAAYRKQNGKPAPLDQVQQWANELFLKGKVPGAGILGFGGGITRIEAEAQGKAFEPEWTSTDKEQARKALAGAGARVDEAAVDSYLRRKHRLPGLPLQAAPLPVPPPPPDIMQAPTDYQQPPDSLQPERGE